MHYSPFVAGAGLLALGRIPTGTGLMESLARILLNLAGCGFLVIGALFVALNLYGALRARVVAQTAPAPRPAVAPAPTAARI